MEREPDADRGDHKSTRRHKDSGARLCVSIASKSRVPEAVFRRAESALRPTGRDILEPGLRAGDSSSPSSPIGQGREYDVRCDMSHLKSRFNKFVRDRSIKAHGRGHRRLSEPAAQRRQARMSCPACDKGQNRKCICGKKRTYKRRALVGVEELLDGDTAAAAPPRAPPPPDPEVAPPGETAAAAGDEPEPDPRMMGLRAPPSEAQAARAKKLRERATVIAAKGRKNKQGVIPAAVMGMLYDFVEECDLERARDVGLFPRTALPRKDLDTPRLNHKDVRSLGTGLPPVSSFPLAGASLLNIDFALVPGVDIKCGHCGSRAVCVTGNTARSKDRLGVVVLHRPMQPPIYACSAIQTCDDCKKTTRHDDPAVLAKLGPCDDMLLPCEHEQCVGTRQHRATREFVDLVSSATAFSDAGWETVSREHSEALAVRRSRNHLSFASCLADYTATLATSPPRPTASPPPRFPPRPRPRPRPRPPLPRLLLLWYGRPIFAAEVVVLLSSCCKRCCTSSSARSGHFGEPRWFCDALPLRSAAIGHLGRSRALRRGARGTRMGRFHAAIGTALGGEVNIY
mmetsp:Transcript_6220/g.20607  ORF Transcript_6220/g.20607 Transcript_6220/m.20607 type:complete len:570 (+) Transcript_6220:1066-2775(+)